MKPLPDACGALPGHYPPVVYVPIAHEVAAPTDAQLEYRRTDDGRMALLAYSALDRLYAGMGAEQPWIVIPTPQLEAVWEADRFDTVLLDVVVPVEVRGGREGKAARDAAAQRESE